MGTTRTLTSAPRLLVLLPQLPNDPASGAARTATTIGELLAAAGFDVETIATTATERYAAIDVGSWLAQHNVDAVRENGLVRFVHRGVVCTLIDTGQCGVTRAMASHAAAYDALVENTLSRFRPQIVLTYGGSTAEVARQRRVRSAGARVIFGLYNLRYLGRGFFDHVDAVITPSRFLSDHYHDRIGLESTPLPTPLWREDVVARQRDPKSVTIVNPSLDKGLMVFSAIARLLVEEHPEIPIEIYLARDSEQFVRQAAFLAGVDFDTHPSVTVHPTTSQPSAIYEKARVVLVPSIVEDAAPRVVAEAFANGVVPIGSDRGGIPEMCADAGFVLPLPRDIDARSLNAISAEVARPWVERVSALFRNRDAWNDASERSLRTGRAYLPPRVTREYSEFFQAMVRDHGR